MFSGPTLLLASALAAAPQGGTTFFTEVGAQRGMQPYTMGGGISAGLAADDFDGDGDVDLFVPNGLGVPDQLYVNDGTGHFVESTAALGVDVDGNHRAALWFDANGDGLQDLLVAGDCYEDVPCGSGPPLRLHVQQPGGGFVETTQAARLGRDVLLFSDTHVGGLAAGDIDGDGDLDLVVAFWEGFTHLYVNDGSGVFTDRAQDAGIQLQSTCWQPVLHDFDGDGHVDIFQAVDFIENHLWINQGDGTFVDRAADAGVDTSFNEMGVALADHDRDGDLDLYITNIYVPGFRHNVLFERQGPGLTFAEVSGPMGVRDSGCGWGTSFVDVDLDGWFDVPASNSCAGRNTRMFHSRMAAGQGYEDVSLRVGMDGKDGSGLVAFDMDGDGDRDLAQVGAQGLRLFENRHAAGPSRGWLVVRPRMRGANSRAIGAVVTVDDGVHRTARIVLAGSSALSQEPAEAHFGLGAATTVDVTVEWPDGSVTVTQDVDANRILTIAP
ncbi:MAG: CRTAC1 family protein [Planctomycetota bacterium]